LSRIIDYVWKDLFDYKNYNYHIFLWKFQFLIGFCTSFESTKLSYLIGLPCIGSIISIICFLLRTSIQLILLNHAWLLISLAPLTPNLLLEFESSNYINKKYTCWTKSFTYFEYYGPNCLYRPLFILFKSCYLFVSQNGGLPVKH